MLHRGHDLITPDQSAAALARAPILFFGLIVCLLNAASPPAADPVYGLRHIGVDQGLSQSHVTAISQDRFGFVWIGTAVGLNRYDGYAFRTFGATGRPEELSGNGIYSLLSDRVGRFWIGTGTGLDLHLPESDTFRHFPGVAASGATRVRAIDSDTKGIVWSALSTKDGAGWTLCRLDPATGSTRLFVFPRISAGAVVSLRTLDAGLVLALVRNPYGLTPPRGFSVVILDPESGAWSELHPDLPASAPVGLEDRDLTMAWSDVTTAWIGAPGPLVYRVDVERRTIQAVLYEPAEKAASDGLVSHVVSGPGGELWVLPTFSSRSRRSAANRIYSLSKDGTLARRASLRPSGPCDLGRNFVISSLIDHTGILWMGLSGAGLCVADLRSGMFTHLNEDSPVTSLSNNFVRAVTKDTQGRLWVGTRVGFDVIDRARGTVRRFTPRKGDPSALADGDVTAIMEDRYGQVWIGTKLGGLHRSAGLGGQFQHFRADPRNPFALSSDHVTGFLRDRQGTLWIATHGGGLNRFDPAENRFASFRARLDDPESAPGNFINALLEDSLGNFWVATEDGGLARFDRLSGRFRRIDSVNSRTSYILSLAEDPRSPGVLWIGTLRHGLARFDSSSGRTLWIDPSNSLLPNSTIYSLLSDGDTAIWAGTNRGLVRVDAASNALSIFGVDQGLQSMEFNTLASFRAPDGELLLGGVGGLNTFYPRNITQNTASGTLLITRVLTFNRDRRGPPNPYRELFHVGARSASQSTTPQELDPESRDLIFNFALLHFADPSRNTFRVKLDGFDSDWKDIGTAREITYTNLNPGDYRFRVRAATSRGAVSSTESAYSFRIARPLYRRPWFLALFAVAALSVAFGLHRLRLRKLRIAKERLEGVVERRTVELSSALDVIESQTQRLRESDALKSRFMTNVSHDFRTPLSITLSALDDIRSGRFGPLDPKVSQELDLVLRNERRLLRLVDQLIDIARMETGKLEIHVSPCDLSALCSEVASAFQPLARRRSVQICIDGSGPTPALCDRDWIAQVATNLILNALRFSPPGGTVTVRTGCDPLSGRGVLEVSDSGPGIPPQHLPHIFDRFYQADSSGHDLHAGLGVGLSLVKEIVDLHQGEIQVQSSPGEGASFRVYLASAAGELVVSQPPGDLGALAARADIEVMVGDLIADSSPSDPPSVSSAGKAAIVLAEDNHDLRQRLLSHLRELYRVLPASNGLDALELVRRHRPDLVLADVMMPGLDGISLCRAIRQDHESESTPVILLTARAASDAKLEGLESGADDYLTKPFEMSELLARIHNMLEARGRLSARLAARFSLDAAVSQDTLPEAADELFLRRVYNTIRENAADPDFGVERLARELAISRMHLYRRLQDIVRKSPTELLMDYRLERSAELLSARTGTVGEVAYAVGFKSLSHFTRRFRDRFGVTPTDFRARSDVRSA